MGNLQSGGGLIARHAKIATVFAVLFGSSSGILGNLITAPSLAIGFWRLTIALPFFIIPALTNAEKREKLRRISKKDYFFCFVSGAFLFGHYFSWFTAVKLTNIASASVLAALHPLVVLLITIFIYRRRVSAKSILAIAVALLGGVLIMGADYSAFAGGNLTGNIMAFHGPVFCHGRRSAQARGRRPLCADGLRFLLGVLYDRRSGQRYAAFGLPAA